MLHASLAHLDSIDPRFLDPDTSLVVMCEDTENALDQARLALDGLASIMEGAASMNAALCSAGKSTQVLEIAPDSMAALMRVLCEKIKPATNNPTLGAVQRLRPDRFQSNQRGV